MKTHYLNNGLTDCYFINFKLENPRECGETWEYGGMKLSCGNTGLMVREFVYAGTPRGCFALPRALPKTKIHVHRPFKKTISSVIIPLEMV